MEILRSEYIVEDEYYHVYNRGTDHRAIVQDKYDSDRFIDSLIAFNSVEPIQSIYWNEYERNKMGFEKQGNVNQKKLVEIICYCLNPNHYHLILKPISKNGISEFMKRIAGYSRYFNERYKRSGSLFQGKYKVKHLDSNDYLLHASAYVNINFKVHDIHEPALKLVRSSYDQYFSDSTGICVTDIILDQFSNTAEYIKFCNDSLELMKQRKVEDKEFKKLLLE
ncbi:MAG: transposase [Candidatus Vogelbacteria bacterium]|nr:transposase [Candidatus Vogelbacteria bacterium]